MTNTPNRRAEGRRRSHLGAAITALFVSAVFLFSAAAQTRSDGGRRPSPAELDLIKRLAGRDRLSPGDAAQTYARLFDRDEAVGREAEWNFERQKAFEILAVALPHLRGTVEASAIDALVTKAPPSRAIAGALLRQLNFLNSDPLTDDTRTVGQR